MKTMHLALVAATMLSAALAMASMARASPPPRGLVVIELFQSQGCSDCPPAQLHLNTLADRPDVLALSFGVTYWDYLGWKDSFASPRFTQRQRDYSDRNNGIGVATPQYWINGRQTVLGADTARVNRLIAQGGPADGPVVTVNGSSLALGAGHAPSGGADVLLVRYDPRTVQVAVRAGENGGRTIPHRNIVHQLTKIGRWNGQAQIIALPSTNADGLKSAILLQAGAGGPLLAAVKL